MKANEIRQKFLDYFAKLEHKLVPSSALIPANDPTLLFTNAGMVQFKEVFLGLEKRDYVRAASSQKCVRAGGKHNDLENVGYTARHHTFFEMLGNFSFGDYFKREAINFAWNFLTQELKLPSQKLWVTVHISDKEAEDIWLNELKIDPKRFSKCDEDNFWSMGDTGPCGPCTEIFYDHGEDVAGDPPGLGEEGDRYIEIWNLVFMQYDRDANGNLTPLPKQSVDTGMGLERLAAVLQGVHSNYEIDLFKNLIKEVAKVVDPNLLQDENYQENSSLRVIADHIRSTSFLIADSVIPSNEGRGYVLRRIIRRAIRHANKLGAKGSFFYKLVKPLSSLMGEAYPELIKKQALIESTLQTEEEQFAKTLQDGLKVLESALKDIKNNTLSGEIIFKLYDTYGFPVDLTQDILREKNIKADLSDFDKLMQAQKERAKGASGFKMDASKLLKIEHTTEFTGYDNIEQTSNIVMLMENEDLKKEVTKSDNQILVILEKTPFYAESGGQVGDKGEIITDTGTIKVIDTQKFGDAIGHVGIVDNGSIKVGQKAAAKVDMQLRQATKVNHTATHLLHAALRKLLGETVTQKGSLVEPDKLRFDFSYPKALSVEQLQWLEEEVNQQVLANLPASTKQMPYQAAVESGAIALFGEKYKEDVRVLNIGSGYSVELCGGTHVHSTGEIGSFKITVETSVAAGIRRIEAVTGLGALKYYTELQNDLDQIISLAKSDKANITRKIQQIIIDNKALEKQVTQLKQELATSSGGSLKDAAINIGEVKLLVKKLPGVDPKTLRTLIDDMKSQLHSAIIVLATVSEGKVQLACGVTKQHINKVAAGELVKFLATELGGKGGGRPDFAQAGGSNVESLDTVLAKVQNWVEERL